MHLHTLTYTHIHSDICTHADNVSVGVEMGRMHTFTREHASIAAFHTHMCILTEKQTQTDRQTDRQTNLSHMAR